MYRCFDIYGGSDSAMRRLTARFSEKPTTLRSPPVILRIPPDIPRQDNVIRTAVIHPMNTAYLS